VKRVLIPILFLIVACHSHSNMPDEAYYKEVLKKQGNIDLNAVMDSIRGKPMATQNGEGGTTYKIGTYLIDAKQDMKYDVIDKKHPSKTRISKGDTLISDGDTLLLGDFQKLDGEGVYKKYYSKLDFNMFKVHNIYKGKLAGPDFKTNPDARYFRTMIRQGCDEEGVNFAGHYTIVEWGCGTECLEMAVVDRINGRIYDVPFDTIDGHWGSKYSIDSRMAIINYYLFEDSTYHPGYYIYRDYQKPAVYVWKDSVFKRIE
jgi:hypothetical protein